MEYSVRPPRGVLPQKIWDEKRLTDIEIAITKRVGTVYEIPIEWIKERNEILRRCNNG